MPYKILTYEQIDRATWAKLVKTSATGTWFQTPEAYMLFASMPDLFQPFVMAISKETPLSEAQHSINPPLQTLRAVCCGYVTVEKSPLKQFFTRRAIIIGGPALADDATDEEVEALMSAMREQVQSLAIYIETRNFNSYEQWKDAFCKAGFNYQPHLNFHVDTSSVDVVESNLGKSRKRDIRTTVREGVTIVDLSNVRASELERERMVREYYFILKDLYETKVKTPLFPESFFQVLAKHPDARFLLTKLNGKIVGGTVCVAQEGKCLYEWFACGEDGVYPHVFPSCYATYASIRYAAEHNMMRFDMMGAGKLDEAYGVRDFKAEFGGEMVEHGRFLNVPKPLLFQIGKVGVRLMKLIKSKMI